MSAADHIFDATQWTALPPKAPDPSGFPHATHSGELRIGDAVLRCYQLSDGRRVIDGDDVVRFLGFVK